MFASIKSGDGIPPKSLAATDTIMEHVCGRKETHWVSATRHKRDTTNAHGNGFGDRRVKIDLAVIATNRIYDLSTPEAERALMKEASGSPGNPETYSNTVQQALKDAKRTKEVLIEGTVPQDSIVEKVNFT